jgi:DUF1365 family protein
MKSATPLAMSTLALLRSFFALPLVTLKIVVAIHWEAAALAQGSMPGAAAQYCSCEQLRYHLGGRRTRWLYWVRVARPR